MHASLFLLSLIPQIVSPSSPLTSEKEPLGRCLAPRVPDHAPALAGPDDESDPRFACGLFQTVIEEGHQPPAHAEHRAAEVYEIPVVFHVLEHEDGRGAIPTELIHSQLRVLNEDFGALAGTPGAAGVDTGIRFVLATVDPEGNPTSGITRTVSSDWYVDSGVEQFPEFLNWDPFRYLNVFTNNAQGFLGYVNFFPQQSNIVGSIYLDYVVVHWRTVGRPARWGPPFHLGRTLTHEIGHYLGLFHVFDNSCFEPPNFTCYTFGDRICDTNPTPQPTFGCPVSPPTCSGLPVPFDNYMDYSNDACLRTFTPEQANRMRCTLTNWRSGLARVLPRTETDALAEVRNRGNPYTYWTTEPWLGEEVRLYTSTAGRTSATLVAHLEPAEITLPTGILLVEPHSPRFLRLSAAGPRAFATVRLPHELELVGMRVHSQAFLHGGLPLQLTNAVDWTLGLR